MDLVGANFGLSGVSLVRDCLEADGNFMVCACLKSALQSGKKVVLVTLHKGASHYASVMRKMGVNLDRCQHQLVVLDPLVDALSSDTTLSCDLGALSTAIQQACSQACSPHSAPSTTVTPGTVILIDSASGLAALHGSAGGAWLDFLRATVQLVSQNLDRIALAVVAHMDAAQDAPWIGWLAAAADCVVTVDPLPTGLAGDVNVKVSLFRPNRWGCAFGLPQQRTDMLNVEVQSTCFGSVTERSVQFRHSSTA